VRRGDRKALADAAVALTREDGCRCAVEIVLRSVTPGVVVADVFHDDGCPALLASRRQDN
jgi:hypothetical protein